jgi:hypothetical protein
LPVRELVDRLALELIGQTSQQDDCTLMGVELGDRLERKD